MDLVATKLAWTGLKAAYSFVSRRAGTADRQLIESRNEVAFDWAAELSVRDREHAAELAVQSALLESLADRIEAMISDPQFHRVRTNLFVEIAREALDERRRMLVFAAAGSVAPGLTIAQIARVERTIRDLDPADLRLLEDLTKITSDDTGKGGQQATEDYHRQQANARYLVWDDRQPSGHLLASSGCVFVQAESAYGSTTQVQGAHVTPLGKWVLEVMNGYLRATDSGEPPFPPAKGGA